MCVLSSSMKLGPRPNFIALLNSKQIFVLTVEEEIDKVQAYFTG